MSIFLLSWFFGDDDEIVEIVVSFSLESGKLSMLKFLFDVIKPNRWSKAMIF